MKLNFPAKPVWSRLTFLIAVMMDRNYSFI